MVFLFTTHHIATNVTAIHSSTLPIPAPVAARITLVFMPELGPAVSTGILAIGDGCGMWELVIVDVGRTAV